MAHGLLPSRLPEWLPDTHPPDLIPSNMPALYTQLLSFSPPDFSNADLLPTTPRPESLTCPALRQEIRAYQDSFKPGIILELHNRLKRALKNGDGLDAGRAWSDHEVLDIGAGSDVRPQAEGFSLVVSVTIPRKEIDMIRPLDFVFLSAYDPSSTLLPKPTSLSHSSHTPPLANGSPHSISSTMPIIKVPAIVQIIESDTGKVHLELAVKHVAGLSLLFESGVGRSRMMVLGSVARELRVFGSMDEGTMMPSWLERGVVNGRTPQIWRRNKNDDEVKEVARMLASFPNLDLSPPQLEFAQDTLRLRLKPLTSPLLLVGPRGSGKTHTLVATLFTYMKMHPNHTIHVTAPTEDKLAEIARMLVKAVMREVGNRAAYGSPKQKADVTLERVCYVGRIMTKSEGLEWIELGRRQKRLKALQNWSSDVRELQEIVSFVHGNASHNTIMERANYSSSKQDAIDRLCTSIRGHIQSLRYDLGTRCQPMIAHLVRASELLTAWSLAHTPAGEDLIGAMNALKLCDMAGVLPLTSDRRDWVPLDDVVGRATVLFSTVQGRSKAMFERVKQPLVIVDDATNVNEAEIQILLRAGIKGLILAGDDTLPPPAPITPELEGLGYGRSLLARLLEQGWPACRLEQSFLMPTTLDTWASEILNQPDQPPANNGGLPNGQANGHVNGHAQLQHQPWPQCSINFRSRYQIIGTPGKEERAVGTDSYTNAEEAIALFTCLRDLATALDRSEEQFGTVAIVGGCESQMTDIRHKLESAIRLQDDGESPEAGFLVWQTPEEKVLRLFVGLVGETLGEIKDVVLLCTTRSNAEGDIGFMAHIHESGSSIFRPRHCFAILANITTFEISEAGKVLMNAASQLSCLGHASNRRPDVWPRPEPVIRIDNQSDKLLPHAGLKSGELLSEDLGAWKVGMSVTCKKAIQGGLDNVASQAFATTVKGLANGFKRNNYSTDSASVHDSPFIHVYGGMPGSDIRVLWSVKLFSYPLEDGRLRYTQGIWLWTVSSKATVQRDLESIQRLCSRLNRQYFDLCADYKFGADLRAVPRTTIAEHEIVEYSVRAAPVNVDGDDDAVMQDADPADEMDLIKGHMVDVRVNEAAEKGVLETLNLPFMLSGPEEELAYSSGPSFVVGRSGTGKTTIMVAKMHARHVAAGEAGCKQMLLTNSAYLARSIKHHFESLQGGAVSGANNLLSGLAVLEEDISVPSLYELPTSSYPLFWTLEKLLRSLDVTLNGKPFFGFARKATGTSQPRSAQVVLHRFLTHYWPFLSDQIKKDLDAGTVFTEIMGVLKGSAAAVAKGKPLSLEEYLERAAKRDSVLSDSVREVVYKAFEAYEERQRRYEDWDLCDALLNIHGRIRDYPGCLDDRTAMHSLCVDEIQDLSESAIILLRHFLRGKDAYRRVLFAGDTAQTISGIDFKFSTLRGLFQDEYIPHLRTTDIDSDNRIKENRILESALVPPLKALTTNFRSVQTVIDVGAAMVDLLLNLFPGCLDQLSEETGLAGGVLPVFLDTETKEDFRTSVFGQLGEGDVAELGAEQVIIVRNEETKRRVKRDVHNSQVLTINEVKGLEYNDVIIFDFFSDSAFKRWRILLDGRGERETFDKERDHLLQMEIKMLYVAITRARHKLWIFDTSRTSKSVASVCEYLTARNLVDLKKAKDVLEPLAKQSTPEEWRERGVQHFERGNFSDAVLCFEKSGDKSLATEARACIARRDAQALEGAGNLKGAAIKYGVAAESFTISGKHWSAGECWESMAELSDGDEKRDQAWVRAAEAFLLCWSQPGASERVLRCHREAPVACMKVVIPALKDADDQVLVDHIHVLHDNDVDEEIPRTAAYVRDKDWCHSVLQALGYDALSNDTAETSDHCNIARSMQLKGDFKGAAESWKRAGDLDQANRLLTMENRAIRSANVVAGASWSMMTDLENLAVGNECSILSPVGPFMRSLDISNPGVALIRTADLLKLAADVKVSDRSHVEPETNPWVYLDDWCSVSTALVGHRKGFTSARSYGKTMGSALGIHANFGGLDGYYISKPVLSLISKQADDETTGWVLVSTDEFRGLAKTYLDRVFSVTSSVLARDPFRRLDEHSETTLNGVLLGCSASDKQAVDHRAGFLRRLSILSHIVRLTADWDCQEPGSSSLQGLFTKASSILMEELWPSNLAMQESTTVASWLRSPESSITLRASIARARSTTKEPTLHSALSIAKWSVIATKAMVFNYTAPTSQLEIQGSLAISRMKCADDGGRNPLLVAAASLTDILVTGTARSWGTGKARGDNFIFLLEKAVVWIAAGITNLNQLVLPKRLIQTELCEWSRWAAGAFILRNNYGRHTKPYRSDEELLVIRDKLLKFILNKLLDPETIERYAGNDTSEKVNAVGTRIVACAAILTMNTDRNGSASQDDFAKSWDKYRKLRGLVDDYRFEHLRQHVQAWTDAQPEDNGNSDDEGAAFEAGDHALTEAQVHRIMRDLLTNTGDPLAVILDHHSAKTKGHKWVREKHLTGLTVLQARYNAARGLELYPTLSNGKAAPQEWYPYDSSPADPVTLTGAADLLKGELARAEETLEEPGLSPGMRQQVLRWLETVRWDARVRKAEDAKDRATGVAITQMRRLGLDDVLVKVAYLKVGVPAALKAKRVLSDTNELLDRWRKDKDEVRRQGLLKDAGKDGGTKAVTAMLMETKLFVVPSKQVVELKKRGDALEAIEKSLRLENLIEAEGGITVESITTGRETAIAAVKNIEKDFKALFKAYERLNKGSK